MYVCKTENGINYRCLAAAAHKLHNLTVMYVQLQTHTRGDCMCTTNEWPCVCEVHGSEVMYSSDVYPHYKVT